jgi:hypothetical protein
MKLLILFLLVKLNVSDADTSATTQHVPYSCGRVKVKDVKKCPWWRWWLFCDYSYKLHFYNITSTDDTISTDDAIKCSICHLHDEGK